MVLWFMPSWCEKQLRRVDALLVALVISLVLFVEAGDVRAWGLLTLFLVSLLGVAVALKDERDARRRRLDPRRAESWEGSQRAADDSLFCGPPKKKARRPGSSGSGTGPVGTA